MAARFYDIGTTGNGGASGNGVVFKVDPSEHDTVLYNFDGAAGGTPNGLSPSLLRDNGGDLYGTTNQGGGLGAPYFPDGCGVVFRVEPPAGKETVLYTFPVGEFAPCLPDPFGPLIQDKKGNLYGTTTYGGGPSVSGTVYKLGPAGKLTVLYAFTGGADNNGGAPQNGLLRDDEGNLFGTTYGGNPPWAPLWGNVY